MLYRRLSSGVVASLSAAGLLIAGGIIAAGPLNPPAGAVAPTYKTLTEVEPRIAINTANTPGDAGSLFKITQPGSYYLMGNITGVVGKSGIEIAASGVTLDLNGFDLVGVPGMGVFDGVIATLPGLRNIAVVNGSIRGWGGNGLALNSPDAAGFSVVEIRASANAGSGILTANCLIHDCSVGLNTGGGISAGTGSIVNDCSAANNTGTGIAIGDGGTVEHCNASGNTLDGILVVTRCVVRANTCSGNGAGAGNGANIHVTGIRNRIEGNTCCSADRGIDVDSSANFIAMNTCSGNTSNWEVVAGNKCLVVNGANAAAISGNAGGVSPGSTDPNANFTY